MGALGGVDCRRATQGSQGVHASVCVWFNEQTGHSKVQGCSCHPTPGVLLGGIRLQPEQVLLSQSSPLKDDSTQQERRRFYPFILN